VKNSNIQAWPTPIEIILPNVSEETAQKSLQDKPRLESIKSPQKLGATQVPASSASTAKTSMASPIDNDHDFEMIEKCDVPSHEVAKKIGKGMR
tara:strand:+ start:471 stop:752 length:282 start_codon:yes stop_codon:yes gene_type:complete